MITLELNKSNFRHILKYRMIQNRLHQLYNVERKRIDDVYSILEKEFLLSEARLKKIINLKVPEMAKIQAYIKQSKPKANQLYLQM